MATLVDNSGYASDVAAKYQAWFVAEIPVKIGGQNLPAGVYGLGFIADNKFVVTDIGGARRHHREFLHRRRDEAPHAAAGDHGFERRLQAVCGPTVRDPDEVVPAPALPAVPQPYRSMGAPGLDFETWDANPASKRAPFAQSAVHINHRYVYYVISRSERPKENP